MLSGIVTSQLGWLNSLTRGAMSFPVTVIQTLSAFVIFAAGYFILLVTIILIGFAGMMVYLAVLRAARHTREAREKFIARLRENENY